MTSIQHTDGIRLSIYTASDEDDFAPLLGEVFAEHDPPAVAVGLTASEFESFVRLFCPTAAEQRLTVIARSADSGALLGALLAEDSATPLPSGLESLSAKFDPIFDILGQLDAEHRAGREMERGTMVHLFLLGVARSGAGRGLGQRLVVECLSNAGRMGYRTAVTEATNAISQHIFRKLGFVERVRRSYAAHRFNGQDVFASIVNQGGPILMDRPIAP